MGMRFRKVSTARKRFLRWHEDDCAAHGAKDEEQCSCGYLTAVKYLFQRVALKEAA